MDIKVFGILKDKDTQRMLLSVTLSAFLGYIVSKIDPFGVLSSVDLPHTWLLTLSLTLLFVLLTMAFFAFSFKRKFSRVNQLVFKNIDLDKNTKQLDIKIIITIMRLRGFNQKATPKNIASELNQNMKIILAHLDKLTDEQFVTFNNQGKTPDLDTDFYLHGDKAKKIIQ